MELISSKVVRVKQEDIADAVLSFVFKTRPDLRPSGMDASESPTKVNFSFDPAAGFVATVILENKIEDGVKA